MVDSTFIAVALVLGYGVAVGLSMLATFGITKLAPGFAVKDHLLKTGYKLFHDLIWLLCVTAGAYVTAWVGESAMHPWLVGVLLATALVVIPWTNSWEVRQRGAGHQILMSVVSVAGVGAGYGLRLW